MPTASKLVAALLMAALAWYVATLIVPYLPEQTKVDLFHPTAAFYGLLVGWLFLGPKAGRGVVNAMGFGLTASVVFLLVASFWFAGYEMIIRSLRRTYEGPIEALEGMFEIAVSNLVYVNHIEIIAVLIVGGFVIGILTELTSRVWP